VRGRAKIAERARERGAHLLIEAPMLTTMRHWGTSTPRSTDPLQIGHTECGNIMDAVMTCSSCGEPIGADDVTSVARA
jgi:hypothetical protein